MEWFSLCHARFGFARLLFLTSPLPLKLQSSAKGKADVVDRVLPVIRAATTAPHLVTLILLIGLSVISLNVFVASLSHIAEDFQTEYGLVSLSIAAVLQLIMGPLSDRFGRRPVILTGLVLFTVSSVGCMLAQNIWVFLGFRLMQGAVICGAAVSVAVVRDMVSTEKAASLLGYMAMAMALAPMLGPMLGGISDQVFGWRASFAFFAMSGAILLTLVWGDLGETNKHRSATFIQQFRTYPELLGSRRFWGYALCMAFSTGAFYVFIAGAPLVEMAMFSMSPVVLGFFIGTITGGYLVGTFLSGRFASRFGLTKMMLAGRVAACFGLTMGLILFALGIQTPLALFGSVMFVGLGNGLTMPNSSAGAMSVRPQLAGSASGLAGALTVGDGAILTGLVSVLITPETGAFALLGLMLAVSFAGLLAALSVMQADRRGVPLD
ncbi:MAG: DHA1 family bicyclomycin/chloramphenicol resistance-like MFS transporter [Paracoccaceae bacterium]|jgi:DHA1 family bicyclomycin/chloramphenicol resistance-like MFS transporter